MPGIKDLSGQSNFSNTLTNSLAKNQRIKSIP
jgi:hypothetical protein